jgi:hypothetical protein
MRVIGVVRSGYMDRAPTPMQSALDGGESAPVEFDFAWLISWLADPDREVSGDVPLRQVPFL